MDKLKEGDRVIVRPYQGWEYAGVIVGEEPSRRGGGRDDTSFYYLVKDSVHGMVSSVNPIKVRLDKEWYREQKLKTLLTK